MKRFVAAIAAIVMMFSLTGCFSDDADVVNENLSKAADNFEVNRRIVVVNGITDKYMLTVEGRCSIEPKTDRIWITCKVAEGDGPDSYKRHQIYRSDNVFTVAEQLEATEASAYHYRMTFKPQSIVPDPDFRGSTSDGPQSQD